MPLFAESFSRPAASAVQTTFAVTTAPIKVAPVNPNRKGLAIRNTGSEYMYLGFTSGLTVNAFYTGIAANITYEFPCAYSGEVWAMGTADTSATVTEFS